MDFCLGIQSTTMPSNVETSEEPTKKANLESLTHASQLDERFEDGAPEKVLVLVDLLLQENVDETLALADRQRLAIVADGGRALDQHAVRVVQHSVLRNGRHHRHRLL